MNMDELQEKLTRVSARAFDSLSGAKIVVDKNGIILYASKYHYEYLGYSSPEEVIGHYVEDIIPGTRMHIVLQTGMPEYGLIFRFLHRVTGKITAVVCNRIPIYDNGKLIGAISETTFPEGLHSVLDLSQQVKKIDENQRKQVCPPEAHNCLDKIIIGNAPTMQSLKQTALQIAEYPLPVLITGETGVGKEVFADAIHQLNPSSHGRFVKINCAAIPGDLLESELFGYEEGAFSGASKKGKIGKFEYAQNGSILLDEIGDMPLNLQAKLLRAIQDKSFERVGGVESIAFNARIICTTNCDIKKLIEEKKFREDLYYRINVLELRIPPLRERAEDIVPLCNYFIDKTNRESGLSIVGLSPDAIPLLCSYNWPGNVRELRHIIERACYMTGAGLLTKDQFLDLQATTPTTIEKETDILSLSEAASQAEKAQICKALEFSHGNKSTAAKLLGIDRTVLYDKIKKYQITTR